MAGINTNNTQWGNFQSDDVKNLNDIYRWIKKLESVISAEFQGDSGWTDTGTVINLTTATDTVQIQSSLTVGGNSTAAGKIVFLEDADNGAHGITVQSPASLAGSYTLTLPTTDGDADQYLKTDGNGVTTWATPTGAGWELTGNTLAAEGTLGTLNNYGVAIKTNNVERMRIGGNTGLGGQRTIGIGNNSSADPNPNNSTVFQYDVQTYSPVATTPTHWSGMGVFQEVNKITGTSADNDAIFAFSAEARIGSTNTNDWGGLYGLEAIRGSVVTSAGATGTITSAYALFSTSHLESMNVTNRYGLYVENPYRPGGHTNVTANNYGIYVQSQTVGTTNYNIYSEGGRHYMSHALAANGSTSTLTCASTSSGSTGGVYQIGLFASMAAGYTGTGAVYTTQFNNTAAGIGADPYTNDYGNFSTYAACAGTTTGTNVGAKYDARNGDVNIGLFGQTKIAKNNATNIGVLGQSINTGSSPIQIGGYFGLQSTTPTYASAALIADNGSQTSPIILGRDNGSVVFNLIDGGLLFVGGSTTPTAYLHIVAGTTSAAQLRLAAGVAPSSPNDGDIYYINTNDRLMFFKNATACEILSASAVTTETVVTDTTLTITYNGTTYKLCAVA